MTRPFDRHLNSDEIDALVSSQTTGVTSSGYLSEQAIGEAQRHVDSCQDCHRKVQMHKSVQNEISRRTAPIGVPSGFDCADDSEWVRVAAGLLPVSETRERMKHAAQCGHCGPLLRAAAETLSEEASPAEETLVASLRSVRPEWQTNMAEILSAAAKPQQRPFGLPKQAPEPHPGWWSRLFSWQRPAFALAAVAVTVVAGWFGVRAFRPPSADQLLAQAYTERRTLEVRIPGAKYAPLQAERSNGGSNIDKPESLLKAEAVIGENLRKSPDDPTWLQAKARADLLDGNYESAIKGLQRALEQQPDSPQLLTDLGSAYYLRAQSAGRAIDFGKAVEALGKALTKTPDDPIALFNHALACEQLFLYTQAQDDWEHYLRTDPQGEWAQEARKRLSAIQEKVRTHAERLSEPLLTPAEIAKGQNDKSARDNVDGRVEDYLNNAILEWLPSAFPGRGSVPSNEAVNARLALNTLAAILASRHQDEWLVDVLTTPTSENLSAGFHSLSLAAKHNAAGDPEVSEAEAQKAEISFRKAGSMAGMWRAQIEEIYASQRRFHSEACLLAVSRLKEQTASKNYRLIAIQLRLEHYACLTSADVRFDKATDSLASALVLAQEAKYPTLYLRALGFSATEQTEEGDAEAAWEMDRAGLSEYWSGTTGPRRASQFYDDMSVSAQESRWWLVSVALGREAVAAISKTPDRSTEGMERLELATFSSQAHLWHEAAEEYSRALASFAMLPDDESTRAFKGSSEVGLAEAAIAQGHFQEADSYLQSARSKLPSNFQEYETWLSFYRTLAALRLGTGDDAGSQAACVSAIQVAELGLDAIQDEVSRLRWNRATTDCYRQMVSFSLKSGDSIGALEFWEWYRGAGARSRTRTSIKVRFSDLDHEADLPRPHGVEDNLASLKGETVIAYAELPDKTVGWAYDDRGIVSRTLSIPNGFRQTVARFTEECRDPKSNLGSLRRDGKAMFDVLLAPFWERIDVRRTLVIETDGIAASVPFGAVVDSDGKYISQSYRIAYLPAFEYRRVLRPTRVITMGDEATIVGSPALGPDKSSYSPLPDADREAQEIARDFGHSIYLTGQEATVEAVLSALSRSVVFHFAGHSVVKPGHAGLLLAEKPSGVGGMLDSEALAKAGPNRLKLAVLSACSTKQDEDATEEASSIARAFLRTGVPNVVATRWSIDSSSTAVFMSMFYEDLLRGSTVTEALRFAMSKMLTTPRYAHPYYWAAFEGFGQGAPNSADGLSSSDRRERRFQEGFSL